MMQTMPKYPYRMQYGYLGFDQHPYENNQLVMMHIDLIHNGMGHQLDK
jgi:hypothetical protein